MKKIVMSVALVLAVAVAGPSTAQAGGKGGGGGGSGHKSMSSSCYKGSCYKGNCWNSCYSNCYSNYCWYPYSYCYQPVQYYYPVNYVSVVPTQTCAAPVCEPVATTSNYTVPVNVQVSSKVSQGPVVGNTQVVGNPVPIH